jgi:hypothetical protein
MRRIFVFRHFKILSKKLENLESLKKKLYLMNKTIMNSKNPFLNNKTFSTAVSKRGSTSGYRY